MTSYKTLVKEQVANAFNRLGDLKQTIVFNNTRSRDYNFATGDVSETNSSVTLQGVVEFITVNEDNDTNSILDGLQVSFIVNKADLPGGYSQFDSFTTNGKTYRITQFKDNGYSIEGEGVGG